MLDLLLDVVVDVIRALVALLPAVRCMAKTPVRCGAGVALGRSLGRARGKSGLRARAAADWFMIIAIGDFPTYRRLSGQGIGPMPDRPCPKGHSVGHRLFVGPDAEHPVEPVSVHSTRSMGRQTPW